MASWEKRWLITSSEIWMGVHSLIRDHWGSLRIKRRLIFSLLRLIRSNAHLSSSVCTGTALLLPLLSPCLRLDIPVLNSRENISLVNLMHTHSTGSDTLRLIFKSLAVELGGSCTGTMSLCLCWPLFASRIHCAYNCLLLFS